MLIDTFYNGVKIHREEKIIYPVFSLPTRALYLPSYRWPEDIRDDEIDTAPGSRFERLTIECLCICLMDIYLQFLVLSWSISGAMTDKPPMMKRWK